jgi:hypothetical protein
LADRHPDEIVGLILENTFLSIPDMVDVLMPWVRLFKSLVLRIKWDNADRIKRVKVPILFMSGLSDELVPAFHMAALHRLAKQSRLTKLHTVPDGTHNDTMIRGGLEYYRTFLKFITDVMELREAGLRAEGAARACANGSLAAHEEPLDQLDKVAGAIPIMPKLPLT